jgi:hypothetical protein
VRARLVGSAIAVVIVLAAAPGAGARGLDPGSRIEALALAKNGLALIDRHWWDPNYGWYDERMSNRWNARMPLLRLWGAFPLFETVNAIAIAEPTASNKAQVDRIASYARRYFNRSLQPVGGYAYYIDTARPNVHAYFDDNGWWAIAFLDAYRATGNRTYLTDTARAFRYIIRAGWDPVDGGIWWETLHLHKTAEPLAAATYVGFRLFRATGKAYFFRQANKLLAWADERTIEPSTGLYGRSDTDETLLTNVEGMMIGAQLELCTILESATCPDAQSLARASVLAFGRNMRWTPAADVIYLRSLLDLYRRDHNRRWYELVLANARRAIANARGPAGLYLRRWSGRPVPGGHLQTHAATLSLFAWLATVHPPPRR